MRDSLLRGNAAYAEHFDDGDLGSEPRKHLVAITCMDTRLDVNAMLGLAIGDAHVLRNAGGRVTDDVVRSLVVSTELLGTNAVAVIQHTECGMTKATNAELQALVGERRGADASSIDFLPIDDHEATIRADVERLRTHPLLAPDLDVFGLLYDIRTGRITAV